jgi:hypothetical protein
MKFKVAILLLCCFCSLQKLFSQHKPDYTEPYLTAVNNSNFSPAETFGPELYSNSSAIYRSNSGKPGSQYWQNRADYTIAVTLDTVFHSITGKVDIVYTNNSPDILNFVWLQLDQNARKRSSRDMHLRNAMDLPDSDSHSTGLNIASVEVTDGQNLYTPQCIVEDTRMQVRLQKAIKASGGKITISIFYHFSIPGQAPVRMGRKQSPHGWIYQIAQWYPRMEVFDDIEGWNSFPYIQGSEFYLEYGNFQYAVTLPANMIVAGSGKLMNQREVLPPDVQKQLRLASESQSTIVVARPENFISGGQKLKTWKFECVSTRDVAWAASSAFVWDAAKINLPGGRTAVAMSVYPIEKRSTWSNSTQYTKYTIECNSKKWYPYPYPYAVNVSGNVPGMEYPGLAFCNSANLPLIAHEFTHTWFPMIVGSNERKYAWMDEGLTTFLTSMVVDEYKKEMNIIQSDKARKENFHSRFTGSSLMNYPLIAGDSYEKGALALAMLRNVILGPGRFDYALKQYINDWAFRHPTPWDFFNAIENAAGEDLDWFWKGWIINNWKLDQAVFAIKYIDSTDPGKGSLITIRNNEKMVMPLFVTVIQEDNTRFDLQFPIEIWMKGADWKFRCNTSGRINEVIIDEKEQLPDINRQNNVLKVEKLISQ